MVSRYCVPHSCKIKRAYVVPYALANQGTARVLADLLLVVYIVELCWK